MIWIICLKDTLNDAGSIYITMEFEIRNSKLENIYLDQIIQYRFFGIITERLIIVESRVLTPKQALETDSAASWGGIVPSASRDCSQ